MTEEKKIEEINIAVVGNVDSSKSSTIGVLTDAEHKLDNGRGSARLRVMNYPHERETGRTSSIGHSYIRLPGKIINFTDLAGHEKYLKTTIKGITTHHPDYAILCVEKNLTRMTREHMKLLVMMKIPFVILITKIDIVPPEIISNNIRMMKKYVKRIRKKVFKVNNEKDVNIVLSMTQSLVPMIETSNVTGHNIDLLLEFIKKIPKRNHSLYPAFVIDNIFNVKGHGTVVSGVTGIDIKKGDDIYVGPVSQTDRYVKTRVRTIHNDYQEFVDILPAGVRGCLWLKWTSADPSIHSGMIAVKNPLPVVKRFKASVIIFHHHTTIKPNYQAFCNIGAVKGTVIFRNIENKNHTLRSGEKTTVVLEFLKGHQYIEIGKEFFFREGTTRGIGKILELIN